MSTILENAIAVGALPIDPGSGSLPRVDFIICDNGLDFLIGANTSHSLKLMINNP